MSIRESSDTAEIKGSTYVYKHEMAENTNRKNVQRCLHDNIKLLPLPRFQIHKRIVPSLNPHNNLQRVSDRDITPLMTIREMHSATAYGEL